MVTTWTNWAGDESCTPARYLQPRSVAEVAAAVQEAAAAGRTVRVVGAGHSFSDLVCTDGLLLNLDHLSGIRHVDAAAGLITVGAGTRLYDLNSALASAGLALANLGDIDRQSIAGATATATHGTGRLLGNLATQIEAVDLVLADGSSLSCTDADPEVLSAARVSLGALGVATGYRLRVVPAFALHAQIRTMASAELTARLDELVDGNDHFEFFFFPHADTALTKRNNRTDEPLRPPGESAQRVVEFLENRVVEAASRIGRRFPARIPTLNRAVTRLMTSGDYVDESYKVFASRRSVRFTEMEMAVPRAACADVLAAIQHTIRTRGFEVNFPIEVRFVAADEKAFLSPSYGRETAYLAVHMYRGMAWRPYFRAVQDIALAHGGRPHWGKRHLLAADQLADRYPAWDRFQAVRARLDPRGVFTNEHVRRVLGPVADVGSG
ncbi:D-arabinono-1,4-lactone oxidase [Skermania piniformis]|uniref:FAD-binding protein n=1 Tax=Skermania pinensis TaxID=39122 RepID=A0ABX8S8V8_9ACTN|nr:D-arabinono-1,4-lactone oxidase [Skermania piniformis]QXQ14304.1 FAD-binding protein [Skermania piniformis]